MIQMYIISGRSYNEGNKDIIGPQDQISESP
jgi:hypothetical protein